MPDDPPAHRFHPPLRDVDTAWAMSHENVEILLEASKAASAGATVEERESFLSILDPDIEWVANAGGPLDLQGEFHGIDQAREYYARWASAWEEWDWEIEKVRAHGDVVVTQTWLTGRGRGSGMTLDMRIGQIWKFRGAKVVRYEAHPSWEQALEYAGLRQPELSGEEADPPGASPSDPRRSRNLGT